MMSNTANGVSRLEQMVMEKYSPDFLAAIQKIWREKALHAAIPPSKKAERKHFLSRKETSPEVAPLKPFEESSDPDLIGFLYKLVLYAPQDWYELVSEQQIPDSVKNDFGNIGVAFDASSRLRRCGLDFYHWRLTEKLRPVDKGGIPEVYYIGGNRKEVLRKSDLPQPTAGPNIRVVAISDTHLFHQALMLPPGDVLIHAGDMCYEESRSTQAQMLDSYKSSGRPLSGPEFMRWFRTSGLQLHGALSWMGSRLGFSHRLLVGGNHDYVLEQLGAENAEAVCKEYGVIYLHTERAPLRLRFRSGASATFWGSGISWTAGVSATRAVQSGNNSFQVPLDQGEAVLGKAGLSKGSVDIMVAHSPPNGHLLAKAADGPDPLGKLIQTVMPKLYVCGHAHRPADPLKGLWAEFGSTLGINAACLGVWNQLHGYPVVVDVNLGTPKKPVPEQCGECSVQ